MVMGTLPSQKCTTTVAVSRHWCELSMLDSSNSYQLVYNQKAYSGSMYLMIGLRLTVELRTIVFPVRQQYWHSWDVSLHVLDQSQWTVLPSLLPGSQTDT